MLEPQFVREYVNTGKARLIYRHFPVAGVESVVAAVAAECAGDQNKFVPYRELLFRHQDGVDQGAFNADNLKNYAREAGLAPDAFDNCFDQGRYLDRVRGDLEEASQIGLEAAPAFQIGEGIYSGLPEWKELRKVIEEELANQG